MSLPSGLIFFLDFQHNNADKGALATTTQTEDTSVYGGGRLGQQITGGVDLTGVNAELGPYALNNGYASPTSSLTAVTLTSVASGTFGGARPDEDVMVPGGVDSQAAFDKLCRFDPDFTSGSTNVYVARIPVSSLSNLNKDALQSIVLYGGDNGATALSDVSGSFKQVRRLTSFSGSGRTDINVYFATDGVAAADSVTAIDGEFATLHATYMLADDFSGTPAASAAEAIGGVVAAAGGLDLELEEVIPEIDIKLTPSAYRL